MELEVTRLRRSPVYDEIIYVDVLIKDFGITIKGIRYDYLKNQFMFPIHKTEKGEIFFPFQMTPETFKPFKKQFLELIQDQKIPKERENVTPEQKKKILDRDRLKRSKKDVRRGLPGQETPEGSRKPE